jgi:hypothetical protein
VLLSSSWEFLRLDSESNIAFFLPVFNRNRVSGNEKSISASKRRKLNRQYKLRVAVTDGRNAKFPRGFFVDMSISRYWQCA